MHTLIKLKFRPDLTMAIQTHLLYCLLDTSYTRCARPQKLQLQTAKPFSIVPMALPPTADHLWEAIFQHVNCSECKSWGKQGSTIVPNRVKTTCLYVNLCCKFFCDNFHYAPQHVHTFSYVNYHSNMSNVGRRL